MFNEVKRRTSHLVGYNIAVMGCIVNGPGEMSDADYGYVGEGKNKVTIYRGKEPVYRSVPEDSAIDMLLELIEEDARNKVFLPRT
ncbi:4-hydroxy-3-methylbut-2-en-1-yl diphosphate synthase (ferredoxin) [bioreactor metagenome]|uniref:4-hydroxy-3-methylbut-2-en-1-yl diphosphate synthase (Ferredoxin) n=1 Tax=bioreactor metagenome TaxID=1076179 RepID=A0A645JHD9_9ZZZZ